MYYENRMPRTLHLYSEVCRANRRQNHCMELLKNGENKLQQTIRDYT